ncbi:hypothetical protein DFH11DRAFT_1631914 [Phellopilus nigrolimitatus]|nr:hypothetical protein DFH11DRAFT_1631914 [Phellopilus nigrolimitatus]
MFAIFTKDLLAAVFAATFIVLSHAAPQAAQCASGVLSCCNLPSVRFPSNTSPTSQAKAHSPLQVLPGGFPECVFASPNAFPCPADAVLACCDSTLIALYSLLNLL